MAVEDQRQAVSIVTTLSGQLMAAALAMIALEGAFLTFALDKKDCGFCFWLFVSTAFLVFVLSIVLGGKGIASLYKTGASGNWNYADGDSKFQWQTGLCCIGLILFMLAVVSARKDKSSDAEAIKNAITNVATSVDKQTVAVEHLAGQWRSNEITDALVQLSELRGQVKELRNQIEKIQGTYPLVITNLVQIAGFTNVVQVPAVTNWNGIPTITNVIVLPTLTSNQPPTKPATSHRWGFGIWSM